MKAAVRTRYGPPEAVRIVEVPSPVPGDDEVLVRVHAATVNRTDCGFRAAKPWIVRFFSGVTKPKVTILGCEFAGVIESAGGGVAAFEVGDRVFGFSEDRFGAHAQYLTMPADGAIATMPADLGFVEAAPSTEGSHYALSSLRKARIRSGRRVLVNGATGAIGSAAVQILKELGTTVTAVCATEHVELVRGLGPDRVIDYRTDDFTKDDQRYDVVLDAVGKSSFARCRRILAPGGVYLSSDLGPLSQNPILALVTPLLGGRKVLFPIPRPHGRKEMVYVKQLIESGAFRPLIDRRYPLDEIVEAYRYVETGQKVGNVVIEVP
ncbi:MAG TPA: NAD(P)-dependent alcohol dehydrogenase [Actinomycetota bacterium]|nr:NAD(P)-dependent alcohol dehydrogenase [Actinomycetota bacterium]